MHSLQSMHSYSTTHSNPLDHLLLYKASSAHDRKERAKEITGYTLKEAPSDRGGKLHVSEELVLHA